MSASATNNDRAPAWLPRRLLAERLLQPIPRRLRDQHFWLIQALIAAVTAFHISGEVSGLAHNYGSARHFPVSLYVIPVTYAALRFGIEGGLLTGLWTLILSAPNITLWHQRARTRSKSSSTGAATFASRATTHRAGSGCGTLRASRSAS